MSSYRQGRLDFDFRNTFAPFAQGNDLPFAEVLTEADVARIFAEEECSFGTLARSFWTPALTVWAFLWQVISPDKSCRQAVANVLMSLALSYEPADIDTGLYCRARAKLSPIVMRRLAVHVGQGLERTAPKEWLWNGRHVNLIDGSSSRLADTEENQKAFPQAKTQKKGLGFPLIRWVAMIGLATATVQDFAYGPYAGKETGETAIFRRIDAPGYRVEEVVVATTLLDAQAYEADDIMELYSERWQVELDIRTLKVTLGMSELRCQTPFMVEREIWAHILAYNLIRKVGAQVAEQKKVSPRSISFKATKQAVLGGWQQATQLQGTDYVRLETMMLKILRKQKVGHRPGRCEPRAIKSRPEPH